MRNNKHHKKFHSNLPEKTTMGMALVKAINTQSRELQRRHIDRTEWIDILIHGGKIKFTTAGAEIILPPVEEKPHTKRIYLGE